MYDSIYTFKFVSQETELLGDVWVGWVTAETGSYQQGQWFYASQVALGGTDGYYVVTGENPTGYELSDYHGGWWEDGRVVVSNYWDASDQQWYVPTDPNTGVAYGSHYLGSESGYVYTSTGWHDFGWGSFSTYI
jgi:hypothetical protein